MFRHTTVLLNEAIEALAVQPEGVYVDCTLGGGGHTKALLERLGSSGKVIGFDQDQAAIEYVKQHLGSDPRLQIVHQNFEYLADELDRLGVGVVDGFVFDLGVSSPQLDQADRGFSYHKEAFLDMRMDTRQRVTAYDIVNEYPEHLLSSIIHEYGEERFAKRIARRIVEQRAHGPIRTTTQLAEIIKRAVPAAARQEAHPARRTFQALRIAVNRELDVLEKALHAAVERLKPQGRICVISFHSLEDRLVKRVFQEYAKGCTCPPDFPICVCGRAPMLDLPGRQPITPSAEEIRSNPRSRSAKLRYAVKCVGSKA